MRRGDTRGDRAGDLQPRLRRPLPGTARHRRARPSCGGNSTGGGPASRVASTGDGNAAGGAGGRGSRRPAERTWQEAIDAVVAAARSEANLVPPIVEAVEAFATLGEISDALRSVFGEHREIDV